MLACHALLHVQRHNSCSMWPLLLQKVKDRRALASKYIRDPAYKKQVRLQWLRLKLPTPPHALAQPPMSFQYMPAACAWHSVVPSDACPQHLPGMSGMLLLPRHTSGTAQVLWGLQQSITSGAKQVLWPDFKAQNSKRAYQRLFHFSAG